MRLTSPSLWRLLALTVAIGAGLRLVDAIPTLLTGLPRGTLPVPTLTALADAVPEAPRFTVLLPHIDPQPAQITIRARRTAVATYREATSGTECLRVATDRDGDAVRAARALPAVSTLQTTQTTVAGRAVDVDRVLDGDGAVWVQARWRARRSAVILRYRGRLDDLLRLVEQAGTRTAR